MSLTKEKKTALIKDFGISANETGSAQVQVAVLSARVKELTVHLQANKKDFSTKRGLLKIISRRRLFLNYLERTNVQEYKTIIERLGLKK